MEEKQQKCAISVPVHPIAHKKEGITGEGWGAKRKGRVGGGRPAVRQDDRPRVRVETFDSEFRVVRGRAF